MCLIGKTFTFSKNDGLLFIANSVTQEFMIIEDVMCRLNYHTIIIEYSFCVLCEYHMYYTLFSLIIK